MKKRFFSLALALILCLGLLPTAALAAEGEGAPAADAVEAETPAALPQPDENGVITLNEDLVLSDTWIITNEVTLDLNGHKISSSGNIWQDVDNADADRWSLISVRNGGDLTINDAGTTGTLQANADDCYAVDVSFGGKCTINGGKYVGNIHAVYVHEGTLTVNGGEFSVQQHYQDESKAYEFTLNCYDPSREAGTAAITVNGGKFYQFDPSNNYAEGPENSFMANDCFSVQDGDYYTVYNTLAAAISAAPDGSELKLGGDVALTSRIEISGKKLTLDLNGHTLNAGDSDTSGSRFGFNIKNGGGLTVIGAAGSKVTEGYGTFRLYGTAEDSNTRTTLNIGENVEVSGGAYTVWVQNADNAKASYGVEVEISGKVSGQEPLYVSGNIHPTTGNVPQIKLHSGAEITGTGSHDPALYQAGYAKTTVEAGVTMTADANTFDIAAGELVIEGGAFTGGSGSGSTDSVGGSITTTTCTALYVKQHSTVLPVKVTVNDGTFTAGYALKEETNSGSFTPDPSLISIEIKNGTFTSQVTDAPAVAKESEAAKLSITGGTFSSDPGAYVADGYQATENNGAWTVAEAPATYTVTVTKPANGTVEADKETAAAGEEVTLTVTPDSGYQLDALTVTDANGSAVTVNNNKFTMPAGNVTVTAAFTKKEEPTPPAPSTPSRPTTTTTTEHNEDGSTTTTKTNRITGTVTETTTMPDGSSTVVETRRDGTVTTTEKAADGSTATTVVKPDGSSQLDVRQADGTTASQTVDAEGNTQTQVAVSNNAVAAATESGEAVALPIPAVTVPAADAGDTAAPAVEIAIPMAEDKVKVEIPVENVTPGTVAVIVREDGAEEVVKTSYVTENGLVVPLEENATVKIVDNAKQFEDMADDHWARDNVAFASSRELFKGVTDTAFMPDAPMTRAMLVTVLARIEGVKPESETLWYGAAMEWAVGLGVTDGTYAEDAISREQLAVMLYRYYGEPETTGDLSQFIDADNISPYAVNAIKWAAEKGILQGKGGGFLDPLGRANRAEVAAMLERFIEQN